MISISGAMVWKIKSKRIWSFQRQYFRERWHLPTDFAYFGFYGLKTRSALRKWIGIVFNTFPKLNT
jgi:hypothetical protein